MLAERNGIFYLGGFAFSLPAGCTCGDRGGEAGAPGFHLTPADGSFHIEGFVHPRCMRSAEQMLFDRRHHREWVCGPIRPYAQNGTEGSETWYHDGARAVYELRLDRVFERHVDALVVRIFSKTTEDIFRAEAVGHFLSSLRPAEDEA